MKSMGYTPIDSSRPRAYHFPTPQEARFTMSAFPPEDKPVTAICRNRKCGNAFRTLYLEQRYCSAQCKDAAAKQRRRERGKLGQELQAGPVAPSLEQVRDVVSELGSGRNRAVAEAQAKAEAEGKSPAEIVRIGQEVLTTFRPQMTEMEKAISAFREEVQKETENTKSGDQND